MSVINIDPDTINTLLRAFATLPGGPQPTFENGTISLRLQGVTFVVKTLQLSADGIRVDVDVTT